jgi:integrase
MAAQKPKPASGTVQEFKDAKGRPYYRARITLPDSERVWLKPRFDKRERAEEYANEKSGEAEARGVTVARVEKTKNAAETCDEYFERLAAARKSEGVRGVREEGYHWSKWISPRIGSRPIAEVTRDEIEDIRNALDAEVKKRLGDGLEAGLSGKTCMNIWSTLRTCFKEAVGARDRGLRVRSDDPTAAHKPPLPTPERTKTFVYPTEFTKLLACEAVPLRWHQAYAVAAYTYLRPEELEALTWNDIDFVGGTVNVSKAVDARTGEPKPLPKTANAVRSVPIEATLMPLLKAMHGARAKDDEPILPILGEVGDKFRAKLFRDHLRAADVTRPRLFADTLTLRPVDFRSLRDTGITWLALSGLSLHAMQRRVGHEDIKQTNGYVKMAEDLSGSIGASFPPISSAILDSSKLRLSDAERAENKGVRWAHDPHDDRSRLGVPRVRRSDHVRGPVLLVLPRAGRVGRHGRPRARRRRRRLRHDSQHTSGERARYAHARRPSRRVEGRHVLAPHRLATDARRVRDHPRNDARRERHARDLRAAQHPGEDKDRLRSAGVSGAPLVHVSPHRVGDEEDARVRDARVGALEVHPAAEHHQRDRAPLCGLGISDRHQRKAGRDRRRSLVRLRRRGVARGGDAVDGLARAHRVGVRAARFVGARASAGRDHGTMLPQGPGGAQRSTAAHI